MSVVADCAVQCGADPCKRMREADAAGSEIMLTLPELCLTGYTCERPVWLGAACSARVRSLRWRRSWRRRRAVNPMSLVLVGLPLRIGTESSTTVAAVDPRVDRLLGRRAEDASAELR